MKMQSPIGILDCKICDESTIVSDPDLIHIMDFGDTMTVMGTCYHCELEVDSEIGVEDALDFVKCGVDIMSWEHGLLEGVSAEIYLKERYQ